MIERGGGEAEKKVCVAFKFTIERERQRQREGGTIPFVGLKKNLTVLLISST